VFHRVHCSNLYTKSSAENDVVSLSCRRLIAGNMSTGKPSIEKSGEERDKR
jgi:hypothetical protein